MGSLRLQSIKIVPIKHTMLIAFTLTTYKPYLLYEK